MEEGETEAAAGGFLLCQLGEAAERRGEALQLVAGQVEAVEEGEIEAWQQEASYDSSSVRLPSVEGRICSSLKLRSSLWRRVRQRQPQHEASYFVSWVRLPSVAGRLCSWLLRRLRLWRRVRQRQQQQQQEASYTCSWVKLPNVSGRIRSWFSPRYSLWRRQKI